MSTWKLGSELSPSVQEECKRRFVHRFTGEHKPNWATGKRIGEKPYPVQFKDDADWLANTRFGIRKDGRLNERLKYCASSPTWPLNPELRKQPN